MSKPMGEQLKYSEILSQIDANYKRMKSMRPIPAAAMNRYKEELNILTSYCSNAIEGNTFTYDETRLLIKEGVVSSARTLRENEDILGHSLAFESLYYSIKQKEPITEQFVKKLHALVLRGDEYAGKFRDAPVYIGNATGISYVAPPNSMVEELVQQFVTRVQSDIEKNVSLTQSCAKEQNWMELFTNISEHHIEFERIHPFFDGNGRTGRLLLNYELLCYGLLPINVTPEMRARYNAAFKQYEKKEKYSTRSEESKYESMAKILAESELNSMNSWNQMFENFFQKTAEDDMEP